VELLALVIGTGVAGRSSRAIAAELIDSFGSLDGVANAEVAGLQRVPGVGLARAVRVGAALQLGRRLGMVSPTGTRVTTAEQAVAVLGPGLRGLVDEELHALYLDRRARVLAVRTLSRGTDSYTIVDPRQVFRAAVGVGAHSVILAHNHPSGDPEPSVQDVEVTRLVADAGQVLGIAVLDHLVIAGPRFCSLAEQGALPEWHRRPVAWVA
jgi:DNA repair protein RadC